MKRRLAMLAALLIAAFVFFSGARALMRSTTVQLFGELVARVETTEPVVALTIDDGPTPEVLDQILDLLTSRGVRATFFVMGSRLAKLPESGQRLVAAGHELGNHTYSHEQMVLKSPGFIRREVDETDALIRAAGHHGEIYFRAPFGHKLLMLPWYLWRNGRTSVTWDIEPDTYPDVASSASAIVAHVGERVQPGSIILLHIWFPARRTSLAAVTGIIDEVEEQGYRFVTLSELLGETAPAEALVDPLTPEVAHTRRLAREWDAAHPR